MTDTKRQGFGIVYLNLSISSNQRARQGLQEARLERLRQNDDHLRHQAMSASTHTLDSRGSEKKGVGGPLAPAACHLYPPEQRLGEVAAKMAEVLRQRDRASGLGRL